jgi:hypothetical protein
VFVDGMGEDVAADDCRDHCDEHILFCYEHHELRWRAETASDCAVDGEVVDLLSGKGTEVDGVIRSPVLDRLEEVAE